MSTQLLEGAVQQRPGERIVYTVNTGPYGGSPTDPAVSVYDVTGNTAAAGEDVSADMLDGSTPAPDGDIISSPPVEGVEGGHVYRLVFRFTAGGNTYAPFVYIHGVY